MRLGARGQSSLLPKIFKIWCRYLAGFSLVKPWSSIDQTEIEMMMENLIHRPNIVIQQKTHHWHVSWWSPLHACIIKQSFVFGDDNHKHQHQYQHFGKALPGDIEFLRRKISFELAFNLKTNRDIAKKLSRFDVLASTLLFWSSPLAFCLIFLFSAQFNQLGIRVFRVPLDCLQQDW